MQTRIFPILCYILAGLMLSGCAALKRTPESSAPPAQLVVVTTEEWTATNALLRRYERQDPESAWIPAGDPIPAVVGRNGLAWGRGVHPETPSGDPEKREGDGKAPAGMFGLGLAFGYAPPESVPGVRMPYRQMTERDRCVDDSASPLYNRLVDEREVEKNWQSHEEMRRTDEQYRLGVVIDHNRAPVMPRAGSCIFLHIWKAPAAGTAGCTAVAATDMETLLAWLRPEANPVIVQLPRAQYERVRIPWDLP
ncbi:MAG: L,D-transpeptidase family protein [Syntrophales bacterium]